MANRGTNLARRGNDLTVFDPWSEMQDMRRTMDDLFSRFFGYTPMNRLVGGAPESWGWQPNVDLWETEDELVLRADLPGFDREDIDLKVTADAIQISAQHREEGHEQPGAGGEGGARSGQAAQSAPSGQANAGGQAHAGQQTNADQQTSAKQQSNAGGQANAAGQTNGAGGAGGSTAVQTAQPQHPRTYHIRGQQRRSFAVSYALPMEIDPNRVSATFKQGVLEVHMPKPEQSRPKQVHVDVQG